MEKKYDSDEDLESRIDELISVAKKRGRRGIAHVVYGRSIMTILLLLVQLLFLYVMMLRYTKYSAFFIVMATAMALGVSILVLNEEINPMYKISWIIPLVVVPVFGVLTYAFIRFQPAPHQKRKRLRQIDQQLKEFYIKDDEVFNELRRVSKDATTTARYLYNTVNYPIYANTSTVYFPSGEKAFRQILIELEKAKDFIFMEYFIVERGIMWDAILEVLAKKVEQGVEVRVMYDGLCNLKLLPYSYPKQLNELGISAKIFSPIVPILNINQNNRDHRKILVVDGKVGFTGGINLADEYINEHERFGYWKDSALMIKGEAVRSFTLMFLQMWNIDNKTIKDDVDRYMIADCKVKSKGYVIPYADSPFDNENTAEQVYLDILNQAEDYVHIMTPYLIPDNEMLMALKGAAKRGVDVTILMPHIPDKKLAFCLARSYYPELMNAGVKIYEYLPGFVHAKSFVSDNNKGVVGSINLDYRSLFLHFECGVYMYDTDALEWIERDFQKCIGKSLKMTMEEYMKLPLKGRMYGRAFRLIAPLM